jgi:hypothetical protein
VSQHAKHLRVSPPSPLSHSLSAGSPRWLTGQRACPHAQLGIPETTHGPTLEYRQLPHGSSLTHSLTAPRTTS